MDQPVSGVAQIKSSAGRCPCGNGPPRSNINNRRVASDHALSENARDSGDDMELFLSKGFKVASPSISFFTAV